MKVSRPAEAIEWVAQELSRIPVVYGGTVVVAPAETGDALFTVSDPAGRGWTGTPRLIEVRPDDHAVEFTVFFSANPPSRPRPTIHLWGTDVRADRGRVSASMNTPWREIEPGDGPSLQGGLNRLVRGDFRLPRTPFRARTTVEPYGA